MSRVIADSVGGLPHVGTFDDLAKDHFENLDFSCVLTFMVDTVPANALPYLAELFDVMGYKGWKFADTEAKQRALIKNAIELNRRAGTPWSIKQALSSIGINNVKIVEGISLLYNHVAYYNGGYLYSAGSVFDFRVIVDYTNFTPLTQQILDDIKNLVLAWKNARSNLVDVSVGVNTVDQLGDTDALNITVDHPTNHSLDYSLTL